MPKRLAERTNKMLLRMRVACVGEPIFKARARLHALVRRLGFAPDVADGILLAFSEALSNAVLYGAANVRRCVQAHAWVENGRLVIEVSDHGSGFHPTTLELPPPDSMSEGGRGLYLMTTFMDDVQWLDSPKGTTVRMTKCCTNPDVYHEAGASSAASSPATSSVGLPAIQ